MATRVKVPATASTTASTRGPAARIDRTPSSRRAQPYHHGNLRASLLEAADAVLVERGAHRITLRDVAKVAGVSHAAPYHHFASLDDLLAALAEEGFRVLGDAMAEAVAVADTRERLLRVSQAYVDCARAHPERFRLMFGPLLTDKIRHPALRATAQRAFGFVLAAASAHDPKRGADLALAGWSLAHGLSHLIVDGVFDGMPLPTLNLDTLGRKLGERLLKP